jgi:hypothetical protein
MPRFRTPPPGFGISTRVPGRGRYVPASQSSRLLGQGARRYPGNSSTVLPSRPGRPPFRFTRRRAARRVPRATAWSIRRSSPTGGSGPAAPPDASPLRSATGRSRCCAGAWPRSHLPRTRLPTVRAFRTPTACLVGPLLTSAGRWAWMPPRSVRLAREPPADLPG